MSTRMTTQLTGKLILAAAVSLMAATIAKADVPGYEFMMFPEGMALVVDPSSVTGVGKAPKGVISPEAAATLTAGAEPVSGTNIVLLYNGKIYIVPDKQLPDGKMASEMVKSAAEAASK